MIVGEGYGRLPHHNLRQELITEDERLSQLRHVGLEGDGTITFIRRWE